MMRVNEIFYSLQGEGRFTGTPSIFIRLAGCNLKCSFCDTAHEAYTEYGEEELCREVEQFPARHVVITGGEPTLQLTASLVDRLHAMGKYVQIETNGTQELPATLMEAIDWVTCSPKHQPVRIQRINELKVVFQGQDITPYEGMATDQTTEFYLQPCDVQDAQKNQQILNDTIEYIKKHPQWKLSLQTHKILNVR